ncbi:DUF6165 family protein [Gynuella sunshinyii]|uniref:Uncharacterized protein n=1 Tax=Gynuella sunshinyii YC6258 TaxID=1445510 RepID=A0A0C5VH14_9GAMM|nr:DUF6165 family protein [Gynuella sunshinyii]AJQ93912.1 hypothetical Protein YC6258_01868 [Gynuella sunshinyii YC6258]
MLIQTPVSLGEVIDKITILEIKQDNITDADKLKNISAELVQLQQVIDQCLNEQQLTQLQSPKQRLKEINQSLWKIEDDIRDCERQKDFGEKFVELARSVYFTNDKRAAVKKEINLAFGSELVEEKSYQAY